MSASPTAAGQTLQTELPFPEWTSHPARAALPPALPVRLLLPGSLAPTGSGAVAVSPSPNGHVPDAPGLAAVPVPVAAPALATLAELRAAAARVLAHGRPVSRRAARRVPLPAVAPPADELRALEYVVVDVETTGGSACHGHRVTEVAAVRVAFDGTVLAEYATLVNPERSIPPFISVLTNITADMVCDAPCFSDIAADLEQILAGGVFVAHNAAFDWRFIAFELERATGVAPLAPVLCTVRLARKVIPDLGARSLDALTYYFDLENEARHRAYGDARVTAAILARLLRRLDEHEVVSWSGLQEFLHRRKPRAARRRHATPAAMDPAEILPQ